jgi:hypothetical protein
MSDNVNPRGTSTDIIARARAILLTPDSEWQAIDAEPASVASLYAGYIVPLAAIPPVATFLHGVVFGYGMLGFGYHPSFLGAFSTAVISYASTLAGVYVLALIIDALAPTFQGSRNPVQALKLVAYASTASWLAGFFNLIPGLGLLGLLGLYSIYLFFRGLQVLMKSPPEKSLVYTVVTGIAAVVLSVLIGLVSSAFVPRGSFGAAGFSSSGTITTPNGDVPLGGLQQAAKAFTDSATNAANGNAPPPVAAETLKAMLPASVAGLDRTSVTSAGGQIGGFGGRTAQAIFGGNGKQVTLTVADLGVVGALAGMTGALGVTGDSETPTSYSKLTQQDGRIVAEEYDRTTRHGSYGVLVANRFLIHAEGDGVPIEDLRNAVAGVDADRLARLGK